MESIQSKPTSGKGSKANIKDWQREEIFRCLLEVSQDGRLPGGAVSDLSAEYNVSQQTVYRIWNRGRQPDRGKYGSVVSRRRGKCGRKLMYPDLLDRIKSTDPKHRSTLRDLAAATGIPKTVLYNRLKSAYFKKYSRPLRPLLTPTNMYFRSKWALSFISSDLTVANMENYVHVDEKWFFLKLAKSTFYGVTGETPPPRVVKNKNFIIKVMVLCAVAKPRWNNITQEWWDGKIGCWPFTEEIPAARTSKNRDRGTPITTPVAVTRAVYKTMLLSKVIPAVKALWPPDASRNIKIQQDNAGPHVPVDDADILRAGHSNGFAIDVVCQPANSPDCNVLDLGFFRALQSNQVKRDARTIDDVVTNVQAAWADVPHSTLLANFRTLQLVLVEVLKCGGGNQFKIPHAQKAKLERLGRLPEEPECEAAVAAVAMARLDAEDEAAHVTAAEVEQALVADEVALCGALEDLDIGGEDLTCVGFAMDIMQTFDDHVVFEI